MRRARCSTPSRKNVPWLSAVGRLAPSSKTRLRSKARATLEAESGGRNFHFGVREHAMGAVLNGMALSKVRPFGPAFLIFSDYGRAAIRLSGIMESRSFYIFTHDSIGVGEDGPTHQPIEQLARCAQFPGLIVMRPADANEVGRGLEGDHAAAPRAGGADPDAASAARLSIARSTPRPKALREAHTCWPMPMRQARSNLDRHGQRGLVVHRRLREA